MRELAAFFESVSDAMSLDNFIDKFASTLWLMIDPHWIKFVRLAGQFDAKFSPEDAPSVQSGLGSFFDTHQEVNQFPLRRGLYFLKLLGEIGVGEERVVEDDMALAFYFLRQHESLLAKIDSVFVDESAWASFWKTFFKQYDVVLDNAGDDEEHAVQNFVASIAKDCEAPLKKNINIDCGFASKTLGALMHSGLGAVEAVGAPEGPEGPEVEEA